MLFVRGVYCFFFFFRDAGPQQVTDTILALGDSVVLISPQA